MAVKQQKLYCYTYTMSIHHYTLMFSPWFASYWYVMLVHILSIMVAHVLSVLAAQVCACFVHVLLHVGSSYLCMFVQVGSKSLMHVLWPCSTLLDSLPVLQSMMMGVLPCHEIQSEPPMGSEWFSASWKFKDLGGRVVQIKPYKHDNNWCW